MEFPRAGRQHVRKKRTLWLLVLSAVLGLSGALGFFYYTHYPTNPTYPSNNLDELARYISLPSAPLRGVWQKKELECCPETTWVVALITLKEQDRQQLVALLNADPDLDNGWNYPTIESDMIADWYPQTLKKNLVTWPNNPAYTLVQQPHTYGAAPLNTHWKRIFAGFVAFIEDNTQQVFISVRYSVGVE